MNIIYILLSIIVLGILIFIHEFGHYIVGKKCGIGVVEFAIGFGPKIFSWEKNGTLYSLRALPIGGYNIFKGEDDDCKDSDAMNNQPIYKRALTVLAGPVFNIVFALLIGAFVLFAFGDTVSTVSKVVPGSPAQTIGIQDGDKIISINGHDTVFSMEINSELYWMKNNKISTTDVVVQRNGETIPMTINLDDNFKMGVMLSTNQTFNPIDSLILSFRWSGVIIKDTFNGLLGLLNGTQPVQDLTGTVAMVSIMGNAMQLGFMYILKLVTIISLSLGIMNLLPLPALDGGRLVFLAYEGIFRKPVPRQLEAKIHLAGIVLLLTFMAFITYNDIINIVKGLY